MSRARARLRDIHAPPPRPTLAGRAMLAGVLSVLWLGGLALVRMVF